METFSAEWLALREPVDHAARDTPVVHQAIEALDALRTSPDPVRVIDLGAGSGSNLRYLAPRLPFPQHWLLLDHDEALLADALRRAPTAAGQPIEIETHRVDLRDIPGSLLSSAGPTLVTGSALLDLVSAPWLERLAFRCRVMQAVVLFVLSYDGRIVCNPTDPLDAEVRELVNRHQHTDKGFGPAVGPDATSAFATFVARQGYTTHLSSSQWNLGPGHRDLQQQLVGGWATAAAQVAPAQAETISAWHTRRRTWIADGVSRILVGHSDVVAHPSSLALASRTRGHRV